MADFEYYDNAIRIIAALRVARLEAYAYQLESAFFGETRLEVKSQIQSSLKEILGATDLPPELRTQATELYDMMSRPAS